MFYFYFNLFPEVGCIFELSSRRIIIIFSSFYSSIHSLSSLSLQPSCFLLFSSISSLSTSLSSSIFFIIFPSLFIFSSTLIFSKLLPLFSFRERVKNRMQSNSFCSFNPFLDGLLSYQYSPCIPCHCH